MFILSIFYGLKNIFLSRTITYLSSVIVYRYSSCTHHAIDGFYLSLCHFVLYFADDCTDYAVLCEFRNLEQLLQTFDSI